MSRWGAYLTLLKLALCALRAQAAPQPPAAFPDAQLQARLIRAHPSFRAAALCREVRDVDGPADVTLATPAGGEALTAFAGQLADPETQLPRWIWNGENTGGQAACYFRRNFMLHQLPPNAHCNITCTSGYVLYVNGKEMGKQLPHGPDAWRRAERYDVRSQLRVGSNTIAIEGDKPAGSTGLLVELLFPRLEDAQSGPPPLLSDASFLTKPRATGRWTGPGYNDSSWEPARELGVLGVEPWGPIGGIEAAAQAALGDRLRYVRDVGYHLKDGTLEVHVPAGRHRVALYYTVPGGFDYHNPEAATALIDRLHGEIERSLVDEPREDAAPAMLRYSDLLPDTFEARMGYSLLDRLPALYDDVIDRFGEPDGPTTIQIRCDAFNVAAALYEEAFFARLDERRDARPAAQGKLAAEIGLLHPATTIHAYTGFGQPTAPARAAADAYRGIQTALGNEGLDYVIVDENSLAAAETHEGILSLGEARVRLMLLPSATVLTGAAVDQLAAFAGGGGIAMVVGQPPARCADGSMTATEFTAKVETFLKRAARVGRPDQVAGAVRHRIARERSKLTTKLGDTEK